ncbi:MAG: terminase large subunit, partial [Desulfomonilia bacterium]|nr:terminase large subunit [Desulfomonilia bacterium]
IADILNSLDTKALVIADSAEPKSIDELKLHGINILPCNKGQGSVNQGIQFVQDQKISVTKRSTNLLKEYRNYLWQTDRDGKVINTEGDPNHPINQGSLCSKGTALYQIANNDKRLNKVLYRAPGADSWKEVSWDWALDKIAKNVKKTRDSGFVKTNSKGQLVNRVENIASLGGAALDSEEVYSLVKFKRALGLVYLEHQARI